mmetsp:Transcript_78318/g.151240  ORF Transcript_78318/g.151240 Transcript_78318/m.151240 type:complete len:208 (-) Transcript_78318:397-1020(-)
MRWVQDRRDAFAASVVGSHKIPQLQAPHPQSWLNYWVSPQHASFGFGPGYLPNPPQLRVLASTSNNPVLLQPVVKCCVAHALPASGIAAAAADGAAGNPDEFAAAQILALPHAADWKPHGIAPLSQAAVCSCSSLPLSCSWHQLLSGPASSAVHLAATVPPVTPSSRTRGSMFWIPVSLLGWRPKPWVPCSLCHHICLPAIFRSHQS